MRSTFLLLFANGFEAQIPASKVTGLIHLFGYITDHQPELGQDSTTVTSLIVEVR